MFYNTYDEYITVTRDDGYGNPITVREKNGLYVPGSKKP